MQPTALLVDDDRLIRQIIGELLRENGFSILEAENGEEGIRKACESGPNLILLDLFMPVMNGIEACRHLRSLPQFRHTAILLMTARKEMEGKVNPFEVGADDYLAKPIDRMDLMARVQGSLLKKRAQEALERQARDYAALLEVTESVTSTLDTVEILRRIVNRIAELITDVFRCSIALILQDEQLGTILASSDDPELTGLRIELADYPEIVEVLKTRRPLPIDVARDPLLAEARRRIEQAKFNTLLVLPVIFHEEVIGVLLIRADRAVPGFSREEIEFCQLMANVSANALKNAYSFESVLEESSLLRETKRRLEAELRIKSIYEQIFENASEGLVAFNGKGEVLFANRKSQEITGYSGEELQGVSLSFLLDFRSLRRVLRYYRRREGDPTGNRFDVRLKTRSGVGRRLSVSLNEQPAGENLRIISFRDVTEKRQMEQDLVETKANLEAANERLRRLDRARAEFLNTAAHELRIPVTILNGYLSLLRELGTENLTEPQREYLDAAVESSDRLVDLTNNMLDLSRLEAGKMAMEIDERNLSLAVQEVFRDFRPLAAKSGVTLDMEAKVVCQALFDEEQIRRVLANLVGNAIKFTPPGGRVKIRTADGDGEVEVTVEDTGQGIPAERVSELFEEFVQIRNGDSRKGTGLGLSICKRIIDSHRGRIWVESVLDQGSRFTFTLPKPS